MIDPLIVPSLLAISITGIPGTLLFFSILYYKKSPKLKESLLKLIIAMLITLALIGAGSLGPWGLLPITILLAYQGWQELWQCIEKKYGEISHSGLITMLGVLGILGGCGHTLLAILLSIIMVAWLTLTLPILIDRKPPAMHQMLGVTFGILFITMPLAVSLLLTDISYGAFSFLVLLVQGNDTFAQAFGMTWGKSPLMPNVSSGKTWSGVIGSFLVCVFAAYPLNILVPAWPWGHAVLVAGGISVLALCGDLLASSLKREAGIKDFGKILAPTGGVLDKFDSLLFALPPFWLIYQLTLNLYP